MAGDLAIVCTAERIKWHDDPVKGACFAANLVLGCHGGFVPADDGFLKLWQYKPIKNIMVALSVDGTIAGNWTFVNANVISSTASISGVDLTKLTGKLEDEFNRNTGNGNRIPYLDWNPAQPPPAGVLRWVDQQAHLSTYPAPLPVVLQSVVFFYVDLTQLPGCTQLLCAPVLQKDTTVLTPGNTAGSITIDPTVPSPAVPRWQYNASAFDAFAYQQLTPVDGPAVKSGSFQIAGTPWLRAASMQTCDPHDWLVKFESTVAPAFDLPSHLIDAVSDFSTLQQPFDFYRAVLLSYHDQCNAGSLARPSQSSTADRIVAQLKLKDDKVAEVTTALANYDRTINEDAWFGVLKAACANLTFAESVKGFDKKAVQDLTNALGSQTDPDKRKQLADQLGAIFAELKVKLKDENITKAVVYQCWQNALSGLTYWNQLSPLLRNFLRLDDASLPSEIPLRPSLLQAVLQPQWSSLKTISGNAPPGVDVRDFERQQLQTNIAAALKTYYLGRFELDGNPNPYPLPATSLTAAQKSDVLNVIAQVAGQIAQVAVPVATAVLSSVDKATISGKFTTTINGINAAVGAIAGQKTQLVQALTTAQATLGTLSTTQPADAADVDAIATSLTQVNAQIAALPAVPGNQYAAIVAQLVDINYQVSKIATAGRVSITQTPAGLTLQVAPLHDAPDPANDYMRDSSGVGVLIRKAGGAGKWYSLNAAGISFDPVDPVDQLTIPSVVPRTLVPFRIHRRNDVRQSLVTYNNRPLAARSPADGLAGDYGVAVATSPSAAVGDLAADSTPDNRPRFIDYSIAQADPAAGAPLAISPWASIPALVFGQQYEIAAHCISNSGALPKSFINGHPTALSNTPPADFQVPPESISQPVTYLRTNLVGQPRFTDMLANDPSPLQIEDKKLTPVPPGTYPLIYDLTAAKNGQRLPLMLLWKGGSGSNSYAFGVQPPSTDIQTYDRWLAGTASATKNRKTAWASVHRGMNGTRNQDVAIRLRDPAVAAMQIRMTNIYPGTLPAPAPVDLPLAAPDSDDGLWVDKYFVTTNLVDNLPPNPVALNGKQVTVSVKAGEIWQLDVCALVNAADCANFVAQAYTPAGASPVVASQLSLWIETADNKMPADTDLFSALTMTQSDTQATLSLTRTSDDFRFIKMILVDRQPWQWNGHPIGTFPFDKTNVADWLYWEKGAYDQRAADNRQSSQRLINMAEPAASGTNTQQLYVEDYSKDSRALYFRYAVTALSRYAGLPGFVPAVTAADPGIADKTDRLWVRLLVKCRWDKPVPRPAVHLVVPLTRPADNADKATAPGLMVLCTEQWYQIGGLAETLQAQVVTEDGHLQFGPDPIVGYKTTTLTSVTIPDPLQIAGCTFDTSDVDPFFGATCFRFAPPVVDPPLDNLSWYMSRMQFKRALLPLGMFGTAPGGGDTPASDWTTPVWAQYLPSSNHIMGDGSLLSVEVLTLVLGDNPQVLAKDATPVAQLTPYLGDTADGFELWLLLTRQITDIYGRLDEQYVGVYRLADVLNKSTKIKPASGATYNGRFLQVQLPPPNPAAGQTAQSLWQQLMPTDTTDVQKRIVAVSDPLANVKLS